MRGRYSVDDFGTTSSIALGHYDIRFTTAYKEAAIGIVQLNALKRLEDSKPLHGDQDPYSDQEIKILEEVQGASKKKRRITPESSPMFIMQLTTCDGLFQLGKCIDLLIKKLNNRCDLLQSGFDDISDILISFNFSYAIHKNFVDSTKDAFDKESVQQFLFEINAFYLNHVRIEGSKYIDENNARYIK